jgi:energy-coupling factor transporter ATP-binding protein EcfA2
MGADHQILKDISMDLWRGDFTLLLGPSSCGKTLLTHTFNGLIPHIQEGAMWGSVESFGMNTISHEVHEFAPYIGMVFQNPDDQIISLKVVNEVAWGVENLGMSHEDIVKRVHQFMDLLGISHLEKRLTFAISGGQKQKVSIASNLAMLQDMLILDDPMTDLDPICKKEVVETLAHLYNDMGKTLLVIEHDLNDLIELANRVIVMEEGQVRLDKAPKDIFSEDYDELIRLGINIPQHIEIAREIQNNGIKNARLPVRKEEVFSAIKDFLQDHPRVSITPRKPSEPKGQVTIKIRDLEFSYKEEMPVLRGINLDIHKGDFLAIVGANGSGKSTLVKNLTGLLTPTHGEILINDKNTQSMTVSELAQDLGYVFQNPDDQLFSNTVKEEVGFSLDIRGVPMEEIERRVSETLRTVELEHAENRHPFSLSRGQRQKLAVATALVHNPSVILLDEPTTGQDRRSLAGLLSMMTKMNEQGNTTIMVTHDMDIVAAYATRMLVMVDGQIVLDGHPIDIFYDHFERLDRMKLRPPTVVDYCRRLSSSGIPRCLTIEELAKYIEEVKYAKMNSTNLSKSI